jgi:predicted RNA-binding protein with PIN domain
MTTWIVDAMNVIGSRPTGWWRDRSAAVRWLRDATRRLVAVTNEPVTLVVDGRPPADADEREGEGVRVVYAARAAANAADDRIVELVASDPAPGALRVVTSDRALQARVRALGAHVVSVSEWLRRVDSTGSG